jgi:hypothetical protein
MADLFSLSGADYLEGFALMQDLLHVLAIDPNSVDHLARSAPTSEAQVRDANDLVLKIVGDGSGQPLHAMLFPAEQLDEVGSAATESGNRGECGDGRCRPADLEQLPDQPPQPSKVQTLTAAALAGLVKTDAIDLSSESKRWMAAVGAILDGIDKHVRALANWLQSQTYRLDSRLYGPLLRMTKARDPAPAGYSSSRTLPPPRPHHSRVRRRRQTPAPRQLLGHAGFGVVEKRRLPRPYGRNSQLPVGVIGRLDAVQRAQPE